MGNYVTLQELHTKRKKSVHTFDEEPIFINCKSCVALGTWNLRHSIKQFGDKCHLQHTNTHTFQQTRV